MFPGEPCAIVVADTQQHAEHAARLVEVLYDEDGTSDDHLLPTNVAEAVRRGVFFLEMNAMLIWNAMMEGLPTSPQPSPLRQRRAVGS